MRNIIHAGVLDNRICDTGQMDEDQLSLRQADQIRGDLYGIQDDLDFIKPHFRGFDLNNIDYQWLAGHSAF